MFKILVVCSRQPISTASVHAFVANVKVTTPSPGFSHKYAWMYNSGTLQQQLCRFLIRQAVWVGTVEPISVNTKWASDTFAYRNLSQKPFGYPLGIYVLKKLIYREGTLQHYLLLLFNICFLLINFNNSGFTYIRCSKWNVYVGWVSQSSDVS